MTTTATNTGAEIRPVTRSSRVRPWIALAAAAIVLAVGLFGVLPFIVALPVIGVVLALGSPPDDVGAALPVAYRPRNQLLGVALVAALAVVILQPQLSLPLVALFGLDGSRLAVTCVAVVALALPLAMADAPADAAPTGWFLLTRRNLILSLTVLVTVANWYGDRGLSFLPIAAWCSACRCSSGSRLIAARRQRLEYGLLHQPLRAGLGPHRLQLANVMLLCALLALTLLAGAYDPIALQLTPAIHRVLVAAFVLGLVAFVLLCLVPLRHVRLGSNLLVTAATIFLAAQLISVYRPPVDAVTVGSPLAGEWWVGHAGHAELVNYHYPATTQRDALDIMQVVDGRIHRPDSTELTSYYIYDQPVLAPTDGTVTFALDSRPDQPIGSVDSQYPTGNHLVIDIGGGHYLLMGHLRQGSIAVNVGERVTEGQLMARVGNSGASSAPTSTFRPRRCPPGSPTS